MQKTLMLNSPSQQPPKTFYIQKHLFAPPDLGLQIPADICVCVYVYIYIYIVTVMEQMLSMATEQPRSGRVGVVDHQCF